jgi:hypothetical protein
MNKKLNYTLLFIAGLFFIGDIVCKFVFNSNVHGLNPSDFLIIGLIFNTIATIRINKTINK